MTFSIHGLPVARGIAIGRAVLVASSRVDVAHYFIDPSRVASEIDRVRAGRNAVVEELQRLQHSVAQMSAKDAPHELSAILDVHLMLLQDEALTTGVKHWITDRLYNGDWSVKRESSGMAGTSVLVRALVEHTGKTVEQIKAFLAGKSQAEKVALRNNPKIKPIVDRIESEKAAKKTSVDTDALLGELDA